MAPRVLIEMAYLKFRSPIASTPRRPRPSLLDQQEDRQSAAAAPDRPGALAKLARAPHGHAMIENIRTHPYTRAVCVETARLFEQRAARDLFKAQYWADRGGQDQAQELQANARLAQQRATAWHLRAKNAADLASAAAVASCRRFTPSRNREKEIDER